MIYIYILVYIYHDMSVCGSTYDPLSCMNSINYTAKRPGAGVQSDRRFLGCRSGSFPSFLKGETALF